MGERRTTHKQDTVGEEEQQQLLNEIQPTRDEVEEEEEVNK